EEHADEAIEGLKEFGDVSKVEWKKCNLADLKQVDQVSRDLAKELTQLDGLICNAGLGVGVYSETVDGIDSHMQVNHFAQAHLVFSLLPVLQRTADSRLVLQSSDLHRGPNGDAKFDSLEDMNRDIGAMKLYARTKLAQLLWMKALVRRQGKGELGFGEGKRVWINATHPGGVVTDQQDQAVEAYGKIGELGVKMMRPLMKDPVEEGCRPVLYAATSEELVEKGINGDYIVPDKKVTDPSKESQDEGLQENLWKLTLQVLKEKLGADYA
ncbi:hypothetical protein LTS18_006321, partial [Coniosporium uncinatum]